MNNAAIPEEIVRMYGQENEYPVINDLDSNTSTILIGDLIRPVPVAQIPSDTVHRSYLRHDPQKLAKLIMQLVNESSSYGK
jgi:hypothetical protein